MEEKERKKRGKEEWDGKKSEMGVEEGCEEKVRD